MTSSGDHSETHYPNYPIISNDGWLSDFITNTALTFQCICLAGLNTAIHVSIFSVSTPTHMQTHTHTRTHLVLGLLSFAYFDRSLSPAFPFLALSYSMAVETELLVQGHNLSPDMREDCVYVWHVSSTDHTAQHPLMCCFCSCSVTTSVHLSVYKFMFHKTQ